MHLEFPSPYHILYASYFVSKEWHHIKYIYSAAGAATPAPVCVCATMSHRYKPSSSPFVSRVFSCHVAICTWHRNLLCMFTNPSSLIQAPFYNLHFFGEYFRHLFFSYNQNRMHGMKNGNFGYKELTRLGVKMKRNHSTNIFPHWIDATKKKRNKNSIFINSIHWNLLCSSGWWQWSPPKSKSISI